MNDSQSDNKLSAGQSGEASLGYAKAPLIQRVRAYLRTDMLVLRWVFLGLYVLLIMGLTLPFIISGGGVAWVVLAGVLFLAQGLLILGAGRIQLCRPIKSRRLWMPALAASFMAALLVLGISLTLIELFKFDTIFDGPISILFWAFIALSWVGWGLLIWVYAQKWKRIDVLWRLSAALFAGSLAELLAAVPSHIIVSRRPGCLVGLYTMLGILAGVYVMLFAMGPMILILILRPRYRREQMEALSHCDQCEYDLRGTLAAGRITCPECGAPVPAQPAQPAQPAKETQPAA